MQLTHALAKACKNPSTERVPCVPVLVYVQRLSRILTGRPRDRPLGVHTLVQYFAIEFSGNVEWLSMLTMALEMRSLVVVLVRAPLP